MPRGDDERDRLRRRGRAASCSERAGLAQREVERGGLEAPSGGSCGRRACSGVQPGNRSSAAEVLGEASRTSTRRRAAAPGRRSCWASCASGVVGDVLAEALLAAALQADHRGHALEAGRDGPGEALERVAVDRQRQVGDALVGAHGRRHEPDGRQASLPARDARRRSGFFALIEVVGLAGRAARRARARAAAGRRARASPRCSGCCSSPGWSGWPASLAHRPLRHRDADRRRARRCWRWRACSPRCGCGRSRRG